VLVLVQALALALAPERGQALVLERGLERVLMERVKVLKQDVEDSETPSFSALWVPLISASSRYMEYKETFARAAYYY